MSIILIILCHSKIELMIGDHVSFLGCNLYMVSPLCDYIQCDLSFFPFCSLGADILYDRSCFPDLVRILAILLDRRKSDSTSRKESSKVFTLDTKCNTNDLNDLTAVTSKGPVAYIATVIRNIDTFNYFLSLVEQANLSITDLTEAKMPFNLLPYMQSYDRSNMRLFTVSSKA